MRDNFIVSDFNKYPYKLFSNREIDTSIIDKFLEDLEKKIQNNNSEEEQKMVTFSYENEKYDIFKKYINFKLIDDNKFKFKAYNKSHLKEILYELNSFYYFYINNKFEYDITSIMKINDIKEIILYPFFYNYFYMLNYKVNDGMKKVKIKIKIKKELLEPLQLYIEKIEIINKGKAKSLYKNKVDIDDKLIFVLNEKRIQFIKK